MFSKSGWVWNFRWDLVINYGVFQKYGYRSAWLLENDHWAWWATGNLGYWLGLPQGCSSLQQAAGGKESKPEAGPFPEGECLGGLSMSTVRAQHSQSKTFKGTKGKCSRNGPQATTKNRKALSLQCPVSSSVKWGCWEDGMCWHMQNVENRARHVAGVPHDMWENKQQPPEGAAGFMCLLEFASVRARWGRQRRKSWA